MIQDMEANVKKSKARDRLVETAGRLFYAEGVRAVGIDRVIAQAEVAKTTLYAHFPSKDDLILAVLEKREQYIDRLFQQHIEKASQKGKTQTDGFFAALKKWFQDSGFRGCAFINAAVELADREHPASKFSSAHKQRFHNTLHKVIAEDYGASVAKQVAPAVCLVVEGAIVTAVLEASTKPADTAKAAALRLIESVKSTN